MARPAVYIRLAEAIQQAVAPYEDGWEIPSVRSLARHHAVSRNTVRRALAILTEQGDIALNGGGRPYVRRRSVEMPTFCKPYPAAALISQATVDLAGDDYTPRLLASFLSVLSQRVRTGIVAVKKWMHVRPIPGGVAIGPPESRFSAVAFRSGAPEPLLAELVSGGAIVMTLDGVCDVAGVDCVAIDCEDEADMAAEHLYALGHRNIGFVGVRWHVAMSHWADGVDPDCRRFSHALLRAKQRLGLNRSPAYHVEYQVDLARSDSALRAAMDRLCRLDPRPTALIFFHDQTAIQPMRALGERRLKCPGDISIIGRAARPAGQLQMTALVSDPIRIGSSAAEHLLNRLSHADMGPSRLLIRSRLVTGPTTGPAPA